jgi:hypothetical protein
MYLVMSLTFDILQFEPPERWKYDHCPPCPDSDFKIGSIITYKLCSRADEPGLIH